MIHDIRLACCLGWRILCKNLGYDENVNTISGRSSHEYDTNILQSFSEGLNNCQYINDMRMVGSILKYCFRCDDRMIESEICTKEKFQSGKEELLDCMAHLFERNS